MSAFMIGDHAPWFTSATASAQAKDQDFIMGGYRAILFFFGSARDPQIQSALSDFHALRSQLEQLNVHFFGISIDPSDRSLEQKIPPSSHFHWLWDFGGEVSIRYGICQMGQDGGITYDPTTFILDENLRILNFLPLETHIAHARQAFAALETLSPPAAARQIAQQAPVLLIPQVFQPEFCQQLIDHYEADGGIESGFMRQDGSKTVISLDSTIKRRRDWLVTNSTLINRINFLISRRVVPEIEKAFHFRATRFERYVVACYEASNQGFFQPHRDNTATGTAHRRFALTLNLNTGSYEGGCLRFPEYSTDQYAPGVGSAILFSCSLLHEATPVTAGRRFVLLSFFYGDEDAHLRQQTQAQIVRSGPAPQIPGNDRIQSADKSRLGNSTKLHRNS